MTLPRDPWFWPALLAAVSMAVLFVEGLRGALSLRRLHEVPPVPDAEAPPVSVVIAARDEERGIEHALASVLAQRYGPLEVVVVDDRSADATGAILDRMAAADSRLRVVHVADLPAGWLGKNHALHLGAAEAAGDYVLFTDADVVMEPDTLARAIGFMRAEGIDHLAAAPRVELPSPALRVFVVLFSLFFAIAFRPWKLRDPESRAHIGIGAFNLVRARAYRAAGGHLPIRMRPDDDLKLGKLMKKHGFRQDFVVATESLRVEWYRTFGELVRGLMKNGYAGMEYRLSWVVATTVAHLLVFVLPWVAVWLTGGAAQLLSGAAVLLAFVMYAGAARAQGVSPLYGVFFPVATLAFLYIVWRAAVVTIANDGIDWRGTHYALDELRANEV
ncbi:MAG TPA: glycosyltransferase family 2 protein [Longimicrobiaceae bacterium]|nr:glycosyltransferase family 2 protein [Longimicrobiaceae bacterium]